MEKQKSFKAAENNYLANFSSTRWNLSMNSIFPYIGRQPASFGYLEPEKASNSKVVCSFSDFIVFVIKSFYVKSFLTRQDIYKNASLNS